MTETDLTRLKTLAVPAPSESARKVAISAARAAFDAGAATENIVPFPSARTSTRRRPLMALAASIALVVVAVPVALRMMGTEQAPTRLAANAPTPTAVAKPGGSKTTDVATRSATAPGVGGAQSPRVAAVPGLIAPAPGGPPVSAAESVRPAPPPPPVVAQQPTGQFASGGRDAKRGDATTALNMPAKPALPEAGVARRRQEKSLADAPAPVIAARPPAVTGFTANRSAMLPPAEPSAAPKAMEGKDRFAAIDANPIRRVAEHPVSTFSIDVDTASYSWVRRQLNAGRLPAPDSVRIEEMINYFKYDYPRPETKDVPFRPTVTVVPSPWSPGNRLVHIAIRGFALTPADRPRANLVLLVDTSGSMAGADRLPLLRTAFRMLVETLGADDTLAIVTYAGNAKVSLEPTRIAERAKVLAAIDGLTAGGSTNGADGLQRAYALAEAGFDPKAVNRVLLGTDGDFNVGIVDRRELKAFIERKRQSGIYLSILGVGIGNHNDRLMQTLAQAGNGVAAYIDTLAEARRVLVEEASSTLFPIANDVKIQVEFNPAEVAEYRLIGYETRALRREDFANDAVDAGDVGSGHAVTAIYEITPVGGATAMEPLRYVVPAAPAAQAPAAVGAGSSGAAPAKGELAFLKLRYKRPGEPASRLIETAIGRDRSVETLAAASTEVRFAVAVAAFGQLLKGLPYMRAYGYDDVHALAADARGEDPYGYRSELLSLIRLAKSARP